VTLLTFYISGTKRVVFRPGILLSGFWVLVLYQGTTLVGP
jgi:hypothetical protein